MDHYEEKMNYRFEPMEQDPEPQQEPPLEQAKKEIRSGKHTGLKLAALLAAVAIVAALGGSALTAAIHALGQQNLAQQEAVDAMAQQPDAEQPAEAAEPSAPYQLARRPLPAELPSNDGGKTLTPKQVYKMNVGAVCGIATQVTTNVWGQTATASDVPADSYVVYVEETNAASVYPTYYLSESEVAAMDPEQLQFVINQIYAKNGYVFRTAEIQNYFSQMPWYVPVSSDASRLQMSSLDRSNLNLLVRYRDSSGSSNISTLGWIWTRRVVDNELSASYVRNLSQYDIQLLINTIYAKNGYIFETDSLQAMFEGQSRYHGVTRDVSRLSFSALDQKNLQLLLSYR